MIKLKHLLLPKYLFNHSCQCLDIWIDVMGGEEPASFFFDFLNFHHIKIGNMDYFEWCAYKDEFYT